MEQKKDIDALKAEIKILEQTLASKKEELGLLLKLEMSGDPEAPENQTYNDFSPNEVVRYSRQMLIGDIGVEGQKKLKNAKVLIVGAGGLGCPCSLYLASAGVGEITIADYDVVDLTNLHRQILHFESDVGIPKVESACDKLRRINSDIKLIPHNEHINNQSIQKLLRNTKYNVVVDCTDNVASRYLLNDACVLNKLPLVSGSALQFDGQLTVFNYEGGPCFRCLFPIPPPPKAVTNCGDGGVMGPVPGIIGALQALETIKIIVGTDIDKIVTRRMIVFDGTETLFRDVKLRKKSSNCVICGEKRQIDALIDYEEFCGSAATDKITNIDILNPKENVNIQEFMDLKSKGLVLDVRPNLEYNMCHLNNCFNVPLTNIETGNVASLRCLLTSRKQEDRLNVLVLCRRGNDSQRAVVKLKELFTDLSQVTFINVKGGLHAYAKNFDPTFPVY